MISVDTGIRAAQVVTRASELGIDTIVTDHHLPDIALPPAVAVLNPNQHDCRYPEKNLCGAAVAFKLAHALLATLGWTEVKLRRVLESFLKMVAIATVADVVPLTGENRVIVKHGLDGLGEVKNPGLRALLDVAGFTSGMVPTARQVAFQIAPRLNAAGRMDTAKTVIDLFLSTDAAHARERAQQLHDQNAERRQVEAQIREICEQCLWRSPLLHWFITARNGIAASWELWRAGWWSASIARCSCSAAMPKTVWRRAPAAAFRRFTC